MRSNKYTFLAMAIGGAVNVVLDIAFGVPFVVRMMLAVGAALGGTWLVAEVRGR